MSRPASLSVLIRCFVLSVATAVLLLVGCGTVVSPVDAAAKPNASCIFQLRFKSPSLEYSILWPTSIPDKSYTNLLLLQTLLTNAHPHLNATVVQTYNDYIFNVTRRKGWNTPDPSVGCRAMLKRINEGSPTTMAEDYGVVDSWIGFKPIAVPAYMRHLTPQPEALYIALGATGGFFIVVQLVYGLYYSYSNRGTLESVGLE